MEEFQNNEGSYQQNTQNNMQGDMPPKKRSTRTNGLIAFALVILIILVLIMVKGCSVTKKGVQTDSGSTVAEQSTESSENSTEKSTEVTNDETFVDESSTDVASNSDSSSVKDIKGVDDSEGTISDSSFKNVESIPELGDTLSSSVLVSSKKLYNVSDTSYAYSLGLILPNNTDKLSVIPYFCSKKTFDGVSVGDTINIEYQVDANGVVSISTVSKNS